MVLLCGLALLFGAQGAQALSTVGYVGGEEGAEDIAINHTTGRLYVTRGDHIDVYGPGDEFLFRFGKGLEIPWYEGTEGESGQFAFANSIAIDQSNGDAYVSDVLLGRITKFDENGNFILMFGKEVNATTEGDICTAVSGDECERGVMGDGENELNGNGVVHFGRLAVDPLNGNVYWVDPHNERLEYWSSGGVYVGQFSVPSGDHNIIAMNGESKIYLAGTASSSEGNTTCNCTQVSIYNAVSQSFFGNFAPSIFEDLENGYGWGPIGVSLAPGIENQAEEHVYVTMNDHRGPDEPTTKFDVTEFTTAGEIVETHAVGIPRAHSIAVDPNNKRILVAVGNRILVLGEPATLPEPVAGAADGITTNGAVLHGSVNPEGSEFETGFHFEYRKDGTSHWASNPASIQSVTVSGSPTGGTFKLGWKAPETALSEETGPINYEATSEEVEAALEGLEGLEPQDVSVRGTPGDWIVTFEGQYSGQSLESLTVTENSLSGGSNPQVSIAPQSDVYIGNGTSAVPVRAQLGGLDPNSTYHVRLNATRALGGGAALSEESTFTTKPEPPVVSLVSPSHVSDSTAILEANVDPRHTATTYYFEYGTDENYGSFAPASKEGDAGSQLGTGGVFEPISGLQPGTEYHFRLVAENEAGKAVSEDVSFTTYTTAEEEWPARDIEFVNNPDKGAQNVFGFWRGEGRGGRINGISPDGTEVPWLTFAGAPGGTSGAQAVFLARRNPTTGWHSIPVAVPSGQQAGNGDYSYAPAAASKDYGTWVLVGEEGFFSSNHPHVYEKVLLNGEHELIANRGQQGLNNIFVSDNGSDIIYQKVSFAEEEEFEKEGIYDFHDGESEEIKMPECPFDLNGEALATKDFSRIFLETTGVEEPCDSPGIYMVDRKAGTITDIAPEGHFLRTNPTGSSVVYVKQDKPANPEKEEGVEENFYKWTEGSTECMSCGGMPRGVVGGTVSEDLSTVYFAKRPNIVGINYEHSDIWVVRDHKVSFIAHGRHLTGEFPMIPSGDGSTVLFLSVAAVTPDPTGWDERTEGSTNGYERDQLYLYRADKGYTECISCSGTKVPPDGGLVGGGLNPQFKISADGGTIAFVSSAALIPEDINQRPDVYEWHNGVLRLVTDGESEFSRSGSDSPWLWGLSDDGRTVVFAEGGVHITGNELDNYTNAYAAVVGGPWFPPETPPAHCTEDSCQGPLQPVPTIDTQGSEKFRGPGNPEVQRQAKHKHNKHKHNKHKHNKHKHNKHKHKHNKHKHNKHKHNKHRRHARTRRNG
jgi:hypothetical protein